MKTIVLYYSKSGHTRFISSEKAKEMGCDIEEVKPAKKSFMLFDVHKAGKRKNLAIAPLKANLSTYDKIVLVSPTWNGNTTPAINTILNELPKDKEVEMVMVSGSGKSKEANESFVKSCVSQRGCKLSAYVDVKQGAKA